jgi:parallel beta-helix repeat protein
MKSVLFALSVAVAANGSVGLYTNNPPLGQTVSRGSVVTFQFVPFVNQVDEHDVVVAFNAAPATIETAAGLGFDCTTSGMTARCTRALFPANTTGGITLTVRMPSGLEGFHVKVIGTITAASGSTQTWVPDVFVPKTFVVRDTNAAFAEAIAQANSGCTTTDPCAIEFDVTGAIQSPLPAISAKRISIDAGKKIVLDGTGLVVRGGGEVTISGFTIQNADGAGILLIGDPHASFRVQIQNSTLTGNLRGLMAYGTSFLYAHDNVISGNRRSGVWIIDGHYPAVYDNTIEENGASGVYFGPGCDFGMADDNQIAFNRDFGVAIDPAAKWTEVRGNSMKSNGQLGIDYNLDLVTPNVADDSARPVPNAPVLTSATYDPTTNKTTISGHVDLLKPADVGFFAPLVDIYRSSSLDAHGMAQGEQELYSRSDYGVPVQLDRATGNFTYIYNGDLTGQFISATYSRMYALDKGGPSPEYYENWQATSEFSNPVRVER